MDLFDMMLQENRATNAPLAERMKPRTVDEFIGQGHIMGTGKLLRRLIESDKLTSLILHGPPGSGKTSLARVIANQTGAIFESINAVTSGVKDLREVIARAEDRLAMHAKRTILFIDEIHRFNKTQQDALLPAVEKGIVIMIGATTENPYYEVNSALISRSSIFRLYALEADDVLTIVDSALQDVERGVGALNVKLDEEAREVLGRLATGDARRALNAVELATMTTPPDETGQIMLGVESIFESMQQTGQLYDKSGDSHYDIISAFIKSMRGSDPDAVLHYLARMIVGGEDPIFIARRIVICASEDVGNADPNALVVAVSALKAVETIGMPEGRIPLAQAATYVAFAPKSNAAYLGIDQAIEDIRQGVSGPVPVYLKDGTALKMESRKYDILKGARYVYPHDHRDHYFKQAYLPDALKGKKYYVLDGQGKEAEFEARLNRLKTQDSADGQPDTDTDKPKTQRTENPHADKA
jgi:putative ATPase